MGSNDFLCSFRRTVPLEPAIGDFDRIRCADAGCLGVCLAQSRADHLGAHFTSSRNHHPDRRPNVMESGPEPIQPVVDKFAVGVDRIDRTALGKAFVVDEFIHNAADRWAARAHLSEPA